MPQRKLFVFSITYIHLWRTQEVVFCVVLIVERLSSGKPRVWFGTMFFGGGVLDGFLLEHDETHAAWK